MSEVTAVIITFNEAQNISRCLKSLSFCKEVLVVDSFSTDGTTEIASRLGARVVQEAWRGFAEQRNFANALVETPWVLSIDADEEVSPALQAEIRAVIAEGSWPVWSIPRKNFHSGAWIRHGGWYPNRLVRLFKLSSGTWAGDEVHEFWQSAQTPRPLHADLHHYSFASITDQVLRNDKYSTLLARRLIKQGGRFHWWWLLCKPPTKFFETYILKKGFLDGGLGFIIAVSAAYSVFLKWAKVWECQRAEKVQGQKGLRSCD